MVFAVSGGLAIRSGAGQLGHPGTGVLLFNLILLWLTELLDMAAPLPLWMIALAVFIAAWMGQFVGHAVEGKRPAFFKDLQFLLIGPAWLMASVYRVLGLKY